MSVFTAPCYRDDALQAACNAVNEGEYHSEFIKSLANFIVEDPGDMKIPCLPGNLAKQIHEDKAKLGDIIMRRRMLVKLSAARTFETLGEAIFGLKAVFHIANVLRRKIDEKPIKKNIDVEFYKHFFMFGGAISDRTQRYYNDRHVNMMKLYNKYLEPMTNAIREMLKIPGAARKKSYRFECKSEEKDAWPPVSLIGNEYLREYDCWFIEGLFILKHQVFETVYVLTRNDVERMRMILEGIYKTKFYMRCTYEYKDDNERDVIKAADKMIETIMITARKANSKEINSLCRTFDIAIYAYYASLSNDISDKAQMLQMEKYKREGLVNHIKLYQILGIVKNLHVSEALDVLNIYRFIPQPDFDYFGAAARQQKLYEGIHQVHDGVFLNDDFSAVLRYYKLIMARAYHKRHGSFPGYIPETEWEDAWDEAYPDCAENTIRIDKIDKIIMTGAFKYAFLDQDLLEIAKDKSLCPANIRDLHNIKELREVPIEKRNYLMYILNAKKEFVNRETLGNLTPDQYDVLCEDKPEAKKPNGRWFMEAQALARIKHSEYENALSDYAQFAPSVIQGKDKEERDALMNNIVKADPVVGDTKALLVSFDIEKFSPHLPIDVHKELDAINADLFGLPFLSDSWKIHGEGKVHYIKNMIHHEFDKTGADFEGLSGKMNTLYHAAVMGYTVSQLRRRGLSHGGAYLAVQIDDGLLRLEVPLADYDHRCADIFPFIERIYKNCAMQISWDKTFVSNYFALFLNDVYINGTKVPSGLRNFFKITPTVDNDVHGMLEELEAVYSTASGAIKAGAMIDTVYSMVAYYVHDVLRKWKENTIKLTAMQALVCFAPVALGGYGVPSTHALGSSTSYVSVIEGIGYLKAIHRRFPETETSIDVILNQDLRTPSLVDKFRNPYYIKREDPTLRSDRMMIKVKDILKRMHNSHVLQNYLNRTSDANFTRFLELLDESEALPMEVREVIYESTREAAYDTVVAKFQHARTFKRILSFRQMNRCRYAYVNEALRVIKSWK